MNGTPNLGCVIPNKGMSFPLASAFDIPGPEWLIVA
jgi:hypothetical protein